MASLKCNVETYIVVIFQNLMCVL